MCVCVRVFLAISMCADISLTADVYVNGCQFVCSVSVRYYGIL